MIFVKNNGKIEYCFDDAERKCFDTDSTCSTYSANTACNLGWWWGDYWGGWWYPGYGWGVYGDNLRYLYTELEAPDEYRCNYTRPFFTRIYCDDEISKGANVYPRIARCKTYRCIGDYNFYRYDYCATINGKDKADRCCAPPEDFTCKEGECDYDYEIVTKEYSVDYELVRPAYVCKERIEYPESYCGYKTVPLIDSCFIHQSSCSPPEKCTTNPLCKEDVPPPDPYKLIDTEIGAGFYYNYFNIYWWWIYGWNQGIFWSYELEDCNCKCPSCATCSEYDCDFAGYGGIWGWWGWWYNGYFGGIGSDCCGAPPAICPEKQGDGSSNPWYCSGTDCVQVDDTEEDFDESIWESGPYSTFYSCRINCNLDDKCIPPDRNLTEGLCCDKDFQKKMNDIKDTDCAEIGPERKEKVKEVLCQGNGCDNSSLEREYEKEICTIDYNKQCQLKKVERSISRKTYEYNPELPDKGYQKGICNSCDPQANEECRANNPQCPSNTEGIVLVERRKFVPEEIADSTTVRLVNYYCKITTKRCQNKE